MEKNVSPFPVFDSDDSTYVLVTIPVHPAFNVPEIKESIRADIEVNQLLFKDIDDLIAFSIGATNGATNGAETLHTKVKKCLLQLIPG